MKHIRIILLSLLSLCSMSLFATEHWGKVIDERHDSILAVTTGAVQCRTDARAQKSMLITAFGAKSSDDGRQTDCKPAFDKAMKKAVRTKGGLRIIVPKGKWFVKGPIHLVSNITLELKKGATLLFSDDPKDYLPMVKTSWEGNFCHNHSPFIYGYRLENVAIVGEGTIDGNCANTFPAWRKNQKKDQQTDFLNIVILLIIQNKINQIVYYILQ